MIPGRRLAHRVLLAAAAVVMGYGLAQASGFAVRNGTVAGGGSIDSAGGYRVVSTVGEPVMGTTSAGAYRLTAGFPATLSDAVPPSGTIFFDGFE
jgi:hypothetical protein